MCRYENSSAEMCAPHILLGKSLHEVRAQEVQLAELVASKHVEAAQRARHDCAQLAQQRVLEQLLGAVRHLSAAVACTVAVPSWSVLPHTTLLLQ